MSLKGLNLKEKWQAKTQPHSDLVLLSVLGGVCGVLCGLVMALFYLLVFLPLQPIMQNGVDDFESLAVEVRVVLPLLACLLLILMFRWLPKKHSKVGIPYVIERLNYHQGHLPWRNAVVQFVSAVIALVGGLSVGKEGPTVHIGATVGAWFAQRYKLSQFGVETLLACGVAGGIAACFHTPLAGVLFAFEVIFLEYRVRYVLPILLSAVIATHVSRYLIGPIEVFEVGKLSLSFITTDSLLACLALVLFIVFLSTSFFQLQKHLWKVEFASIYWRYSVVAFCTALVAVFLPQAMGSSFDSFSQLLQGELIAYSLLALILVKMLLSALSIGLGVPGGMIGPTFMIGGLAGIQVALWFDMSGSNVVLFALLGMAAMMATCFQAPLTALVAMIEMTHSSEVIAPALFVIVLSCLFAKTLLGQESIFIERLDHMGVSATISAFQRHLRRQKVAPVAEPVVLIPHLLPIEQVKDFAASVLNYVVFEHHGQWYLLHCNAILDVLQKLNDGPQPWLEVSPENKNCINIKLALDCQAINCLQEPDSLETMLNWFQRSAQTEVLVQLSDDGYCLVRRHRLDEFLLKESA